MLLKKNDVNNVNDKKLTILIAGVPGIGKTTLALSSPKPLLIDLENGMSRVNAKYWSDRIVCNSIDEIYNDLNEIDLSQYETFVIDTAAKIKDYLIPEIIKEDPKGVKRNGELSLAGYGILRTKFKEFITKIKSYNKNLILLFHATEVNLQNDLTGLRIRMEGSSKDIVWDDIDVGGFIEIQGKERILNFKNNERYYAKGTHGLNTQFVIPELDAKGNAKNDFITKLIEFYYKTIQEELAEDNKYNNVMKFKDVIENATKDNINTILNQYLTLEHIGTSKVELANLLNLKAQELGLTYDKATRSYQ